MLTPSSYEYAYSSYQNYLLQCLNQLTAGTPLENSLTKNIVANYARDPAAASLFNHASMAFNNHHFFSTLSPDPIGPSRNFHRLLSASFGSFESLRATMIATANAMFGPGYVWLVRRREKLGRRESDFALLTTYIAGSPLPQAHYRKQEQDYNTAMLAGSFGPSSGAGPKLAPGGADIEVALGVSTWQHVWLRDYGFGGRKEYLENWWESVDWGVVESNAQLPGQYRHPKQGHEVDNM